MLRLCRRPAQPPVCIACSSPHHRLLLRNPNLFHHHQPLLNTTKLSILILSLASTIIFFNIPVTRKEKPVTHTFYEKNTEGQDDVSVIWKEEWSRAGFETRVLTTDDVKNYPYFYEMKEMVQSVFDTSRYHTVCYYRWLAMAAAGGG